MAQTQAPTTPTGLAWPWPRLGQVLGLRQWWRICEPAGTTSTAVVKCEYSSFHIQDQVLNWQVVNAASRPVSPMSAGFGESAEDLESHIQTQVWLQVWNLRKSTNWLSQDYLYIYLDLCSNLAFLIIRCNKWKGRCTLLWCICVFRLPWQGIEILSFHIPEEW